MADSNTVADVVASVETAPVATSETIPPSDKGGEKPNTSGDTPEAKANRFEFTKAREAEKYKKLYEEAIKPKDKVEFNEETDPDGSKEMDYKIKTESERMVKEQLDKLGLNDKIASIEREREIENFRKGVLDSEKDFEKL